MFPTSPSETSLNSPQAVWDRLSTERGAICSEKIAWIWDGSAVDYSLLPTAWIAAYDMYIIRVLLSPQIPLKYKGAVSLYERLRRAVPDLGNCFWPAFYQRYCELATDAKATLARQALEQGTDQTVFWKSFHGLMHLNLACPLSLDEDLALVLSRVPRIEQSNQ